MVKKYLTIILLLTALSIVSYSMINEQKIEPPYVVMVSFDGFRHDYVVKYNAPNFKKFISEGVAAEGLIPSFPSKTFPNHYSLVTGLYPGNHGLVDNAFYARDLDLEYNTRNRKMVEDPRFYGGTPLWQLVQESGLKSASYFWVGSEAPIKDRYPDYYHIYDGSINNEDRIEAAIDWLKLPAEERPHFITLYFSLVDSQGHGTGPNSIETGQTVLEADRLLGLFLDQLETIDLDVNVILTSDHGMNEILPKEANYMTYDQLQGGLDRTSYKFISNGAHAHFYLNDPKQIKEVYKYLKKRETTYSTYLRKNFPKQWHYQNKDRTGDIIITMESGHYLASNMRIKRNIDQQAVKGEHGFDPYALKDMQGIFYARGPQIKRGVKIPAFKNIDVYPFVAQILGISSLPPIDGDANTLAPLVNK